MIKDCFLIAKVGESCMIVECKASFDESLSPSLMHFNDMRTPRYAVQVAIDAEDAGINPLEYKGPPIKVPAAELLTIFV